MNIQPATSYQMLALLSADMHEAEQAAVWVLVRYLRENEVVRRQAPYGPTHCPTHTSACASDGA